MWAARPWLGLWQRTHLRNDLGGPGTTLCRGFIALPVRRELRGLVEGATENSSDQPRSERSLRRGARLGSPAAMQVADRFHLLLNLSAAVERALEERSRQLQLPFPAPPPRVSLAQDSPQAKNDPARFSQTAAAAAPPRPLRTSYRAVSSGMFAEEDQ